MPNPHLPATPQALYGLQKAHAIGADPAAQAMHDMKQQQMQAALPDPENRGSTAVDGLLNLARNYTGPVQETLGEHDPTFTPTGGEGLFNVARGGVRKAADAAESAYGNIMARMGR